MGMRAHCPADGCDYSEISDSHRGATLGTCPRDGTPLRAHTAGRAKGRYVCPITGHVVTLGLRSAVQLTQPARLVFRPGVGPFGKGQITSPGGLDDYVREEWERAKDLVLGPGCVIVRSFDPPEPGDYDYGKAGIHLEPAPDTDPATWFVNQPVTYRKCAGCSARVVADDSSLMTAEWAPKRSSYWTGRNNRSRRLVPTSPGPHPAGTYACKLCREGEPDPFACRTTTKQEG
jgi:hypothetical protein